MLLTRSPLDTGPKAAASFDLHVLSTPPAFVLSQDQTLRRDLRHRPKPGHRSVCSAAPRLGGCVSSLAFREPAAPLGCGETFGSPGAEAPGGPAGMPDRVLTDIASGHAARADARTRYASVSSVFKKQSPIGDYRGPARAGPLAPKALQSQPRPEAPPGVTGDTSRSGPRQQPSEPSDCRPAPVGLPPPPATPERAAHLEPPELLIGQPGLPQDALDRACRQLALTRHDHRTRTRRLSPDELHMAAPLALRREASRPKPASHLSV